MKKVLVKWIGYGCHFIDGVAYQRVKNDEDIVTEVEAKKMALTGQVEIVGPPGKNVLEGLFNG